MLDFTNEKSSNIIKAPIDGSKIKKATFVSSNTKYKICLRCVMDTTDPEITFNNQGICNYCTSFDEYSALSWLKNNIAKNELDKMITEIKDEGYGKEYDCIIGLSGGADSSYLATKVHEWGLKPLVVHVDAGWNSELAVRNIEQICRKLNFDLVTHVVNWEQMKDMQLAFLKSGLANQDTPQDHVFFAALYSYAKKAGIKNVINGSNMATESVLPTQWGHDAMDATLIKSIHKKFGKLKLTDFPIISFLDFYFKFPYIYKMKIRSPLNLVNYVKSEAIKMLEKNYGWKYYGGKHYESRWTKFFQGYYLPYKFGYDKRKAHLSSLILSKQISRKSALVELKKPLYDITNLNHDLEFISKKLDLSVSDFKKLIDNKPTHFSQFPNHERKKKLFFYIGRLLSYIPAFLSKIKS